MTEARLRQGREVPPILPHPTVLRSERREVANDLLAQGSRLFTAAVRDVRRIWLEIGIRNPLGLGILHLLDPNGEES
jgi:hypothetical protein